MSRVVHEARSFLFVPGDRPERLPKALASGADAVVVDLEDAVAPDAKARAREAAGAALADCTPAQRGRCLVRINAPGAPWHDGDVAWLRGLHGLGGVMLPKAEQAGAVAAIADACPGLPVLPLVESAWGLARLDSIARAPQVARLALGHIDLQADLGMACGPDEAEVAPARWLLVWHSRLAGLAAPVDGVSTELKDLAAIGRDAQRSRRMGFGAKLCIHPLQVAPVHAALSPGEAECEWARAVLAGEARAGGAAFSVQGRMVDAPVVQLARQLLARAR